MNNAIDQTYYGSDSDWKAAKAFRFHVAICKEDDGTYSAIALNLPGVGSCGDDPEVAMENFKEAAYGAVEAYLEAEDEIPWTESSADDIPPGATHKWIIVDV